MKMSRFGTAALMAILGTACASTFPAPYDKLATSEAAVKSATDMGAKDVPQAASYLEMAQNELDQGKGLIRKGDNRDARDALLKSQADADVATAAARENKTRVAANEAKSRLEAAKAGQAPAIGGGPGAPPPAPPAPKPAPAPTAPQQQPAPHQQQPMPQH
jgi:hypothetical protein